MPRHLKRYRRRSSRSIRRSKKIPVILGICGVVLVIVGIIVLAATLVGLKLKSEAEKYEDTPEIEYITPNFQLREPKGDVREVNGQIYSFKQYVIDFTSRDIFDLSLMLRGPEGELVYNSEVARTVGWDSFNEKIDLADEMEYMHSKGAYACSYMYIGSFSDTSNMAEIKMAYEKQLVIEAASFGVDEILLLGIDVTSENLDTVLEFLFDIKSGAGDCKIGIELDYNEIVSDDPDSYVAQIILQACDFVSLDATSVPCVENSEKLSLDGEEKHKDFCVAIEEIHYYMSMMQVRLTFSEDEAQMYKSLDACTYINRQMHE